MNSHMYTNADTHTATDADTDTDTDPDTDTDTDTDPRCVYQEWGGSNQRYVWEAKRG